MDSVDKHWSAHLKTAFVLYMAYKTIRDTLKASKQWNDHSKLGGKIQMLLLFNAFAVALATIFKLTSKHIAPLFVLQCLSHYSFFLTFNVMVRSNENQKVRQIGIQILKKTKIFHLLFAVTLIGGYFLAECKQNSVYPISFIVGDVIFCAMFFMINQIQSEDLSACWENNLSEKEATAKKFTETQFKTFFGSIRMMAGWHLLELALGKLFFETVLQGAVTCGGEG